MVTRRAPSVPVLLLALMISTTLAAMAFAQADRPTSGAARAGVAPPGAALAPSRPLTAEEKAVLAVREETRQAVDALAQSMQGLPDGPVLRALQLKVVQTKRDGEIKFLRVKAQFARARGDLAAAHVAEDRIDAILHPRVTNPLRVDRPTPDKLGDTNR